MTDRYKINKPASPVIMRAASALYNGKTRETHVLATRRKIITEHLFIDQNVQGLPSHSFGSVHHTLARLSSETTLKSILTETYETNVLSLPTFLQYLNTSKELSMPRPPLY